jgi:2-isopropylmalate synthase
MHYREAHGNGIWNVPYLPIDPTDVGRVYEADVIRINSQSGKGGIGYLLETKYSLVLPPKMREVFGYHVKSISDHAHKELTPDEVHNIFLENYVNISGHLTVKHVTFLQIEDGFIANVAMSVDGQKHNVSAQGNGRLDAVSNAISSVMGNCYTLDSYSEHALEDGTTSRAASYVSVKDKDGKLTWGVGIHSDIMESSVKALVSAINRMLA